MALLGEIVAVGARDCNFENAASVRELVREIKPNLIVNAAAYTAVDKAESEPERVRAINAVAPAVMAEEAHRLRASIIHYSTDYVFSGDKDGLYTEEDTPVPVTVYGETKLEGEAGVLNSGARAVVLRPAWIYAGRGSNFLLTMLKLGRERDALNVVNDQRGSPTWARMIAEATACIAVELSSGRPASTGIFHMPSAGTATWYEFAQEIFRQAKGRLLDRVPELKSVSSAEYKTVAKRPTNGVLSGAKIEKIFGISLPDWKEQLALLMETMAEAEV